MIRPPRRSTLFPSTPLSRSAVHDENAPRVAGPPGPPPPMGGFFPPPAGIADRRGVNAVQLPELALGAPEAPHPENSPFRAFRKRRQQRGAKDGMPRWDAHRLVPARKRFGGSRHAQ